MTTNDQPKVTKATVLGENCGACSGFYVNTVFWYDGGTHIENTFQCGFVDVEWDSGLHPITGTDHPPGRSVCPEFEAME